MWLNKNPQCVSHIDIKISCFQEDTQTINQNFDEEGVVTLIKVLLTIVHLQVLLLIKIGYLLLTNCYLTLPGDSARQTVH